LDGCAGGCVGVGAHGKCTDDQSGKDLFHTLTFLGFQRPPTIWSTTSTPCAVGKLTTGLVNICEPCPLRSY
jgi:hypothetical protein